MPAQLPVHFDDGDLLVLDKPSGLPVLPAGGWLEHTLLRLLERRHGGDPAGIPRPVHRLGRFTSGLLVCARQPASRAWLSAQLRESTGARLTADGEQGPNHAGAALPTTAWSASLAVPRLRVMDPELAGAGRHGAAGSGAAASGPWPWRRPDGMACADGIKPEPPPSPLTPSRQIGRAHV